MAASVRTRVVSWKDAADKNESDFKDARVIPNKIGFTTGGFNPLRAHSFSVSTSLVFDTWEPGKKSVSPSLIINTFWSICLMMISMCLSAISTP